MTDILGALGAWPLYVWLFVLLIVAVVAATVERVVTRHHASPDVSVRMTALSMAIDSHGTAPGMDFDACFTARARHFEGYLRSGAP